MNPTPIIAIIGRPNTGKSTLFNRLVGKKLALVDDTAGTTRDRRYGAASLGGMEFAIIDTAGMEDASSEKLEARMMAQTREAMKEADVILFMVDARAGITPVDETFAREVRASNKPVILVANKAEGRRGAAALSDVYGLGFENVALISAEHGEGMGDLFDALAPLVGEGDKKVDGEENEDEESDREKPIQIAVLGRPNAGKSTLVNALLGEDRLLTGPEAGITRDSIAVPFDHSGMPFLLIDTAGMRKRANIHGKLEKLAVSDAIRAMQYAEVVVILLDATAPLEKQDANIAALVEREGRACVVALNKWDLISGNKKTWLEDFRYQLDHQLFQLAGVSVVTISASRGTGLDTLMKACLQAREIWNARVATGELNRWLEGIIQHHTPPMVRGRRLKIKYMTQIKSRPPTFQLFTNMAKEFPDAYLRYLVAGIRETFGLKGTPIRMTLKVSDNPFKKKKK